MKMTKWSPYAKYLVLSDRAGNFRADYIGFLDFVTLQGALKIISNTERKTYLYEGQLYNKKITAYDAREILKNILNCKWDVQTEKMFLVASQLNLNI